MEETDSKKDLTYYSIEIRKDKEENPLIIVKFKSESKNYWTKDHYWHPTVAELEFLLKTAKSINNNGNKNQNPKAIPTLLVS